MRHATEGASLDSGLAESVIDRIRRVFSQWPAVERAWLYGSRAKGTFRPGSDIDLALEGDRLDENQVLRMSTQLDDLLLPYEIDLCRLEAIQNGALLAHVRRVGQVFYERAREP